MTVLWVILAIAVLIGLYLWALYNRLVQLRNGYRVGFAGIDVLLKRRYDLIPNLVEAVKGYMQHEKSTLDSVISSRGAAAGAATRAAGAPGDPATMKNLGQAESELSGALGRLMAVVESYPELKADQNVMALQGELTGTENEIASARQVYNLEVMDYNNSRETFPAVVFAGMLGFTGAALLESTQSSEERAAPKVKF